MMRCVDTRPLLAVLLLLAATLALGACNTTTGVGKDVDAGAQAVDDAMQETANDIQGEADAAADEVTN